MEHAIPKVDLSPKGPIEPLRNIFTTFDKSSSFRFRFRLPRRPLLRVQLPRVGQGQKPLRILSI